MEIRRGDAGSVIVVSIHLLGHLQSRNVRHPSNGLNVLTGKLCSAVQFRCARVEVGQDSQGSRTKRNPSHPPRRRSTATATPATAATTAAATTTATPAANTTATQPIL